MTKSGAAPVDVGELNDQGRCSVCVVRQDIWPRTVGKARCGKVKAKKGRGGKEGKGKRSKIGMAGVRCTESWWQRHMSKDCKKSPHVH